MEECQRRNDVKTDRTIKTLIIGKRDSSPLNCYRVQNDYDVFCHSELSEESDILSKQYILY